MGTWLRSDGSYWLLAFVFAAIMLGTTLPTHPEGTVSSGASTTCVDLSRFQFATTAAFHMTFPALSVGLAIFLVISTSRARPPFLASRPCRRSCSPQSGRRSGASSS